MITKSLIEDFFHSFLEIEKARKLHKGILELPPPRIGEIDVSPEGKLGF